MRVAGFAGPELAVFGRPCIAHIVTRPRCLIVLPTYAVLPPRPLTIARHVRLLARRRHPRFSADAARSLVISSKERPVKARTASFRVKACQRRIVTST